MTIVSASMLCLSVCRRVESEDLAVVHDRDAVAELVRLLHVVGRQHDRLALAVQLAEDLPQREAALRVEPGRGLVHEEHRGAVEDRPCDHEPLRHPARQGMDARLGPFGQHELLEQLVGDLACLTLGDAEQKAVEIEVLPDGE